MASCAKAYKVRVRLKLNKAGRKRKLRIARQGSTPTKAVLFGDVKKA